MKWNPNLVLLRYFCRNFRGDAFADEYCLTAPIFQQKKEESLEIKEKCFSYR